MRRRPRGFGDRAHETCWPNSVIRFSLSINGRFALEVLEERDSPGVDRCDDGRDEWSRTGVSDACWRSASAHSDRHYDLARRAVPFTPDLYEPVGKPLTPAALLKVL